MAGLLLVSRAEKVEVKGGRMFCFYESLATGANWGVQFQSEDGEFRVTITSPSTVIYEGASETYGSYAFQAKQDGKHTVCFENKAGIGTSPRKINFSILGSSAEVTSTKLEPVQLELRELNSGLRAVRDENEFLLMRENQHRDIALSTNRRVMWWFVFQAVLLAGVSFFQVYYLKRFFEVRRVV